MDLQTHTHPVSEAPELTKNQKKKRRQKLARKFKNPEAEAKNRMEDDKQAHQQPEKRAKFTHVQSAELQVDTGAAAAPRGISSAEPQQRRPQVSHSSVDAALPSALHPGAPPHHTTNPQRESTPSVAVNSNPICRVDLTDAALKLSSFHRLAGPAAPNAASQLRGASPATESAASAELPGGASLHTATTTGLGAPPAAPSLEQVAPRGPDGSRIFIHGNYHRYYGYRLGAAFSEDPRLALLEKSWYGGKRCMDVGCNEGLITLGIAAKFGARSMIGVDIDEHLIKRACSHLREERAAAAVRAGVARHTGTAPAERKAARIALAALAQTWFVHGDFLEANSESGSVDCLTALSVTKWVHLHRGDEGLRAFFARAHSLLAPGGLFVLEPQPWRSYRAAASKMKRLGPAEEHALRSTTFFHRLSDLHLRPESFPDLLCDEYGFRLVKRLQPPGETAAGFDRQMLLFRKI